jgi:monothiol glutaredoxin
MDALDSSRRKSYLSISSAGPCPRATKGFPMADISEFIDNSVKTNDVFLFMKGTPDFPQCGFSSQVVQILNYLGVDYKTANVLADQELREGVKVYANWPTIPQLYIKGEFIGGADIVREMFQSGELQTHFADQGIEVKQPAA